MKVDHRYFSIRGTCIDAGAKIREFVYESGARNGEGARSVEAEEPDAGVFSFVMDVGSNVDLVKARDERNDRASVRTNARERERDQSNVGISIERVDFERPRKQLLNPVGRHDPMQEQKVMPVLAHQRGLVRGSECRGNSIDSVWKFHEGCWEQ